MIYAKLTYADGRVGVSSAADEAAMRSHIAKLPAPAPAVERITADEAAAISAEFRRNAPREQPDQEKISKAEVAAMINAGIARAFQALHEENQREKGE